MHQVVTKHYELLEKTKINVTELVKWRGPRKEVESLNVRIGPLLVGLNKNQAKELHRQLERALE